ncbi:MAG: glycosyltransferase family 39 protein, partial [Brevinematales bacterium]|nr:glycosyltransferase family 39 protein [Brevinematales bacterium]
MIFLSLSYIHTLIVLLTAFVFTLYNFLKTRKLDVKKIAVFLISIVIANSLFYVPFLKSLYSDQVVLNFFLLFHLIVNVLVLFLYILYYDKSVFGAKFQNLLLLSSVVVFGQVYNISNFIELEKLRKEQMVVKDKIYQSSNKDLFFGPYISLPNGIYEYQIRYESKEDLNYKVTLLSGRLLQNTGVLRTGNSVESGRLLIENNIGVNLEFIIFNNVQTKDQTFVYEYKIYPVHILEHFFVSVSCYLIISLVVYLLLRIGVLIVGEYVFRFKDFERHFSVLFSCLITATILIWTASVVGLVTKSDAIYVLLLLWLFSLVFFLSFLLLLRQNALKYLTIFVVVLTITLGISINFGLPQINIYPDEIDIVRGIVAFLMFPNLFHSNEWPYFFPHHYSHIHLSYVVMYPLSLVANLVYPEYGISFFGENQDKALVVARFISMIFATLSVIALFALTRELFENMFVATISSVLLGIAPMFFHMSHVAKTDTAIIFAIIASMYFSVLFGKRNNVKYLFASLFFAAMAASYKIN